MKYPQLTFMPPGISEWFRRQLELKGVDASVYARYVLSILYRDPADVISSELESYIETQKENRRPGGGRKRLRRSSGWWDCDIAEVDRIKRSAAVECLLSASDQEYEFDTLGLEFKKLVDDLCVKMNNIDNTDEGAPSPPPPQPRRASPKLPDDPVDRYYAAFPALSSSEPTNVDQRDVPRPRWPRSSSSPPLLGRRLNVAALLSPKNRPKVKRPSDPWENTADPWRSKAETWRRARAALRESESYKRSRRDGMSSDDDDDDGVYADDEGIEDKMKMLKFDKRVGRKFQAGPEMNVQVGHERRHQARQERKFHMTRMCDYQFAGLPNIAQASMSMRLNLRSPIDQDKRPQSKREKNRGVAGANATTAELNEHILLPAGLLDDNESLFPAFNVKMTNGSDVNYNKQSGTEYIYKRFLDNDFANRKKVNAPIKHRETFSLLLPHEQDIWGPADSQWMNNKKLDDIWGSTNKARNTFDMSRNVTNTSTARTSNRTNTTNGMNDGARAFPVDLNANITSRAAQGPNPWNWSNTVDCRSFFSRQNQAEEEASSDNYSFFSNPPPVRWSENDSRIPSIINQPRVPIIVDTPPLDHSPTSPFVHVKPRLYERCVPDGVDRCERAPVKRQLFDDAPPEETRFSPIHAYVSGGVPWYPDGTTFAIDGEPVGVNYYRDEAGDFYIATDPLGSRYREFRRRSGNGAGTFKPKYRIVEGEPAEGGDGAAARYVYDSPVDLANDPELNFGDGQIDSSDDPDENESEDETEEVDIEKPFHIVLSMVGEVLDEKEEKQDRKMDEKIEEVDEKETRESLDADAVSMFEDNPPEEECTCSGSWPSHHSDSSAEWFKNQYEAEDNELYDDNIWRSPTLCSKCATGKKEKKSSDGEQEDDEDTEDTDGDTDGNSSTCELDEGVDQEIREYLQDMEQTAPRGDRNAEEVEVEDRRITYVLGDIKDKKRRHSSFDSGYVSLTQTHNNNNNFSFVSSIEEEDCLMKIMTVPAMAYRSVTL